MSRHRTSVIQLSNAIAGAMAWAINDQVVRDRVDAVSNRKLFGYSPRSALTTLTSSSSETRRKGSSEKLTWKSFEAPNSSSNFPS